MRRLPLLACAMAAALGGCAEQPQHPRRGWHGGAERRSAPFARSSLFLSPMGEPFRGEGGREAQVRAWFAGADADHDGRLTRAEFRTDAARFFAALDLDHDGELDPQEVEHYETEVAPEIRVGGFAGPTGRAGGSNGGGHRGGPGGHRGGGFGGGGDEAAPESAAPGEAAIQGAARFSFFPYPEPVTAADADMDRAITRAEFLAAADQRFLALDANHDGVLTLEELPPLPDRTIRRR